MVIMVGIVWALVVVVNWILGTIQVTALILDIKTALIVIPAQMVEHALKVDALALLIS